MVTFLEALLLFFTGTKEILHVLQAVLLSIHPLTFLQWYDTGDSFLSFENEICSKYLLDLYSLLAYLWVLFLKSVMKKVLGPAGISWIN